MKRCIKCKKTKPLSEFNKSSYTKDGHGSRCRECWRIFRIENRDRLLVYYKQYATEHRAKILRQTKEWCKANHEKVLQYQHLYNRTPRGKAALRRGDYKRRALLASCEINDLTTPQTEVLLQGASVNCPICSKPFNNDERKKSIDHIIPLSKEGNNTLSNIQIICLNCNQKKGRI